MRPRNVRENKRPVVIVNNFRTQIIPVLATALAIQLGYQLSPSVSYCSVHYQPNLRVSRAFARNLTQSLAEPECDPSATSAARGLLSRLCPEISKTTFPKHLSAVIRKKTLAIKCPVI